GRYAGLRFPIIPGSDGVGEIAAIGRGVAGVSSGASVAINPSLDWGDDPRAFGPKFRILGLPDNGTFAEQVAVPAANVLPRAAAREATGGLGPDLIIDGTGGATFEQALDAARPGGRVVSYGATTGNVPELTVRRVFWKQLSVLGSTMGSPDDFRAMLALFGEGRLRPVIDRVFSLADAGAALLRMERAEQFGKIVLRIA